AVAVLADAGADVVEIELPFYIEMTVACSFIFIAEALAYHLPDLRSRWTDYSPGARKILGIGLSLSAADYVQAQRARRVGQKAIAQLFADVDLVVTPTTSSVALPMEGL